MKAGDGRERTGGTVASGRRRDARRHRSAATRRWLPLLLLAATGVPVVATAQVAELTAPGDTLNTAPPDPVGTAITSPPAGEAAVDDSVTVGTAPTSPLPGEAAVDDSVAAGTAPTSPLPGEAAVDDSVAVGGGSVSPRGALWRSALLPGWGQWRTGHRVKALLFAGAAGGWLGAAVVEGLRGADTDDAFLRQEYAARRNTRILWYLITATAAGLDAYVDAHLADFEIDAGAPDLPGARLRLRF